MKQEILSNIILKIVHLLIAILTALLEKCEFINTLTIYCYHMNISVPRPDGITIMASENDQPTPQFVISNDEAIAASLEDTVRL